MAQVHVEWCWLGVHLQQNTLFLELVSLHLLLATQALQAATNPINTSKNNQTCLILGVIEFLDACGEIASCGYYIPMNYWSIGTFIVNAFDASISVKLFLCFYNYLGNIDI